MTLHTQIAVLAPVPVKELYDWINANLLRRNDPIGSHEEQSDFDVEHFKATGERRWIPNGIWEWSNKPGQRLDALMWIAYRPDGPLHPEPVYEDEGDGSEPYLVDPAMAVQINFDTAYGYEASNGPGCGDLHAAFIVKIGEWLDARGVDWSWYNEFTGEWHGRDITSMTQRNQYGHLLFGDPTAGLAVLTPS